LGLAAFRARATAEASARAAFGSAPARRTA
jgi:hypothetical protein